MEPIVKTVELPVPQGKLKKIILRKPISGEMRGIKMLDVINMEVGTIETLLRRISTPVLTPEEFHNLDMANLISIMAVINNFLEGSNIPQELNT